MRDNQSRRGGKVRAGTRGGSYMATAHDCTTQYCVCTGTETKVRSVVSGVAA